MTQVESAVPDLENPEQTFRPTVEPGDLQTVLVLSGRIDLEASGRMLAEAERLLAGAGPVALDWRAVEHLGAGAIQVLLALEAALTARGRTLRVAGDNPDVRRFLDVAGLSAHFQVLERNA